MGCTLGVRLKPGARRQKVVSVDDREICVSVTAPPVDGKANKALIEFLAEVLGIPKSALSILRGRTARIKLVGITGLTKEEAVLKIKEATPS